MRITKEKFNEMMRNGFIQEMSKSQLKDLEIEYSASDKLKVITSANNYPILEINNITVHLSEKETEAIHDALCNDLKGKEMQKSFNDMKKYEDSEGEFGDEE